MKIEYVSGDLMQTSERVIIHGCNSHGVMGSGVARLIRDQFPVAYHVYRNSYLQDGLSLGTIVWAETCGKIIGNAITQRNYGRVQDIYVDYDAVRSAMKNVNAYCVEHGIARVAMPKIGAGLGGGDWIVIAKIIEDESLDFTPVVYVL